MMPVPTQHVDRAVEVAEGLLIDLLALTPRQGEKLGASASVRHASAQALVVSVKLRVLRSRGIDPAGLLREALSNGRLRDSFQKAATFAPHNMQMFDAKGTLWKDMLVVDPPANSDANAFAAHLARAVTERLELQEQSGREAASVAKISMKETGGVLAVRIRVTAVAEPLAALDRVLYLIRSMDTMIADGSLGSTLAKADARIFGRVSIRDPGLSSSTTAPAYTGAVYRVAHLLVKVDLGNFGDGSDFARSYTAAVESVLKLGGGVTVVRVSADPSEGSVLVEVDVTLARGSTLADTTRLGDTLGRHLPAALRSGDQSFFRRVELANQDVAAPATTRAATTTAATPTASPATAGATQLPARPTLPPGAGQPTTKAPATSRAGGAAGSKGGGKGGGGPGGSGPTGCQPWGQSNPRCAGLRAKPCSLELRCVWVQPPTATTPGTTPPPTGAAAPATEPAPAPTPGTPAAPSTAADACEGQCFADPQVRSMRLRRKGHRSVPLDLP